MIVVAVVFVFNSFLARGYENVDAHDATKVLNGNSKLLIRSR